MASRNQGMALEPAGPVAMPPHKETAAAEDRNRAKKRTGTSKYDFIKVKVWLGENMDHYYILSRFLISRMLTVTKIPAIKANRIALEVKKYLVDNDKLDVTQAEFENVLFSIMWSKGYNQQYVDCYKMVTQFYQQRQPLVILVCGTAWTGKSTIAQQLANRVNIPNVMQTDVIYELLRGLEDTPLHETPLWARKGLSGEALVQEFRRECRVVRKGMDGDLIKTLSDGKPIIMEGLHMDPGLYIQEFSRMGIIMLPARPRTSSPFIRGGSSQGTPRYRRSSSAGRTVSARQLASPRDPEAQQQQQQQQQQQRQQQMRRSASAAARLAATATKAAPLDTASTSSSTALEGSTAGLQLSAVPRDGSPSHTVGSESSPFMQQRGGKAKPSCSGHHIIEQHAWQGLEPIPEDAYGGRNGRQPSPEPTSSQAAASQGLLRTDALQQQQQHEQQAQQHIQQQAWQQQQQEQQQQQQQQQHDSSTSPSSRQPAPWQPPWRPITLAAQHRRTPSDDVGTPGESSSPAGTSREHSTTEPVSREASGCWLPSQEHSAASSIGLSPSAELLGASPPPAAHAHMQLPQVASPAAKGPAGAAATSAIVPAAPDVPRGSPQQGAAVKEQMSSICGASELDTAASTADSGSSADRGHSASARPAPTRDSRTPPCSKACDSTGQAESSGVPPATCVAASAAAHAAVAMPRNPPPLPPSTPASPFTVSTAPTASPLASRTLTAPQAAAAVAAAAAATPPASHPAPHNGTVSTTQQPPPASALPLLVWSSTAGAATPPAAASSPQSSTAAAPASALPPLPPQSSSGSQRETALKPLFVPILVYMDPADHNLVAEEALGSLDGAVGGARNDEEIRGAIQRMRLLQDYLCAYEAQGLPVVRVQYGNFNEALDKLHEYILQCFRKIMGV